MQVVAAHRQNVVYVCVGDEKNAKRVLRFRGVPEAQLDAEIACRARLQEAVGGGRR